PFHFILEVLEPLTDQKISRLSMVLAPLFLMITDAALSQNRALLNAISLLCAGKHPLEVSKYFLTVAGKEARILSICPWVNLFCAPHLPIIFFLVLSHGYLLGQG